MSEAVTLGLVCLALAAGASAQRITGIGIALISAPVLVLAFGPITAVPLSNAMALVLNVGILATSLRRVEWFRAATIALGSGLVILPLAPLLRLVDARIMQAAIGIAVLAAIGLTLRLRGRDELMQDSTVARMSAGATAGAFGSAAGLSGPPLAVYAARTGWRGPTFVPTLQGVSVVINVLAVASAPRVSIPHLWWGLLLVAVASGSLVGSAVAPRLNPRAVETGALALGTAGATTTVLFAFL